MDNRENSIIITSSELNYRSFRDDDSGGSFLDYTGQDSTILAYGEAPSVFGPEFDESKKTLNTANIATDSDDEFFDCGSSGKSSKNSSPMSNKLTLQDSGLGKERTGSMLVKIVDHLNDVKMVDCNQKSLCNSNDKNSLGRECSSNIGKGCAQPSSTETSQKPVNCSTVFQLKQFYEAKNKSIKKENISCLNEKYVRPIIGSKIPIFSNSNLLQSAQTHRKPFALANSSNKSVNNRSVLKKLKSYASARSSSCSDCLDSHSPSRTKTSKLNKSRSADNLPMLNPNLKLAMRMQWVVKRRLPAKEVSDIMKRKSIGFVSSPIKSVVQIRKMFSPSVALKSGAKDKRITKKKQIPEIVIDED